MNKGFLDPSEAVLRATSDGTGCGASHLSGCGGPFLVPARAGSRAVAGIDNLFDE